MSENPPSDLGGLDRIPSAARIRSRRLNGGVATLVVDATGLDDAARSNLEAEIRDATLAEESVSDVRIAMTVAKPERKMIAVASGKGGVGKSTLSANLAIALSKLGFKVGLVDADIYGPSQPRLLGSDAKPEAEGKKLIPVGAQGIKFLSLGQLVSPGHALAWRGPMASGALAQLVEADWGDSELLIVDLPPGTGDVQLSLVQKSRPDGALIVSTPQDLSLIDAVRAVDLFRKTGVPLLGIVENMAGYVCPHCGEESDPFGRGGVEAEASTLGIPFLGRLPLSRKLREASDSGVPLAGTGGPESDAFGALARRLVEAMETQAG